MSELSQTVRMVIDETQEKILNRLLDISGVIIDGKERDETAERLLNLLRTTFNTPGTDLTPLSQADTLEKMQVGAI